MRKYVWAALCSSLVAACGGGGGDGAPATPQATVGISSTNQDQVGRAAASAVVSIASVSSGATASSGGAGVASVSWLSRQAALALNSTRKLALANRAQPMALVDYVPLTQCTAGGTAKVTLDDTNSNGQPDIGETLTFVFTNCKSTANDNVNGTIGISIASAGPTAGGITFTGTMTFAITGTEGARTATINGAVAATYTDITSTVSRTDLTVGASNLTGSVTAGGVTETLTYENGFTISETDTSDANGNTIQSSTLVSGGLTSSVLAGRVVLATQTPIVQLAADAYPSSGVLRATGTSGSALRLTALNATQVQVELDADGNGSYEATTTLPWSTVLPG